MPIPRQATNIPELYYRVFGTDYVPPDYIAETYK